MENFNLKKYLVPAIALILLASLFGLVAGAVSGLFFYQQIRRELAELNIMPSLPERITEKEALVEKEYLSQISQEQAIIRVVEQVSPSVVSIIVTKDLPIIEEYWGFPFEGFEEFFGERFEFRIPQRRQEGTERREIGGGTGFIVSQDGLVLTNKHVVLDKEADYTVLTNEGRRYSAEVLAKDPFQDLAILKIKSEPGRLFKPAKLGDSDNIRVGQTVIAIGNALGEFRNTVSTGVVSGLGRRVVAAGGGFVTTMEDVIQTDAAINRGNSGGPLLDLKGEVIGINTAMAIGAENIGFAIPINKARKAVSQVKEVGRILHPFLGICWTQITPLLKQELRLPVDYGALIQAGRGCPTAIFPDSAAQKAGLKENDIILEWDGEKLTPENSLGRVIQRHIPGDKISLKILRNNQEKTIEVILGERDE